MKGFWIPLELMNLDISWTKRILLAEISQLEMLDKGCIASNSHFADKLGLSSQAVSKALNELAKDELIDIDNAQTKRNFGRKITINFSKSAINFSKSAINQSGESKENKQTNKQISKRPTMEEISGYVKEKNLNVNPKSFFDYFEAGNWIDAKGNKVKNWKQKILTWDNHSKPKDSTGNSGSKMIIGGNLL